MSGSSGKPVLKSGHMNRAFDLVVIGGGVAGLAAAHELAVAGKGRVAVFDAGMAGGGTSLLGGGGIRSQFLHPVNVRLTLRMQEVLKDWPDRFGGNPDFQRNGYLYLGTSPEHLTQRDALAAAANAAGARVERLGAADVAGVVPGMRTDGILAAWHSPDDGVVSPHLLFGSLRDACLRAGVAILEGQPVRPLVENGRAVGVAGASQAWAAGDVVVAAGLATRDILAGHGVDLPIFPQHGQIFAMDMPPALPRRTPLVLDMGTRGYFVTTRQGLVVGGSDREDRRGFDAGDWARVVGLLRHRVSGIADTLLTGGQGGIRAASPDDLGIVGRVPGISGLHVIGGFGHHGMMHAVPAAELLADIICGRSGAIDPAAMDPARFATGNSTRKAGEDGH